AMLLVDQHPDDATFDRIIRHLGHSMFPWSAIAPVALGRLMMAAPRKGEPAQPVINRESSAKLTLLAGAITSFVASTMLVPWAGLIPFWGVVALGGAVGVLAAELHAPPPSRLAALAMLVLTAILYFDLTRDPSRMLSAFSVDASAFPKSFTDKTATI